MPSPAHPALRPTSGAAVRTGGPGTAAALPYGLPAAAPCEEPHPIPETAGAASTTLRIECSREGLARARSLTRDTPRVRSLGHRCDGAALVVTADAATHAAPRCAGAPVVRPGFRPGPAHPLLTVSDPDDHPPVHLPGAAGSAPEEHGRGLCIVDPLSEARGRIPAPSAGKTVRARLSPHPPT